MALKEKEIGNQELTGGRALDADPNRGWDSKYFEHMQSQLKPCEVIVGTYWPGLNTTARKVVAIPDAASLKEFSAIVGNLATCLGAIGAIPKSLARELGIF